MSETLSNEKMNPVPTPRYYKISFIGGDETAPAPQYCVPKSWVTVTNKGKNEVMVAYPQEPWKTTEERARRCDDPQGTWKSSAAHFRGATNHFSSLICSEDEQKYVEDNGLPSAMTAQPGPSCSSTSAREEQCNESFKATSQILDMDDFERRRHKLSKGYEKFRAEMEDPRKAAPAEDPEDSEFILDDDDDDDDELSLIITRTRVRSKIYIKRTDLDECKKLARSCLHLARLLTRPIFSDEAMKKCIYVGKDAPRPDLALDEGAVVAIVHFVWGFGLDRNWKLPSETSIRNAIRYELLVAKKSP